MVMGIPGACLRHPRGTRIACLTHASSMPVTFIVTNQTGNKENAKRMLVALR